MKNLVKDASIGPLREAINQGKDIAKLKKEDMRPITLQVCKKRLHAGPRKFKIISQIDH